MADYELRETKFHKSLIEVKMVGGVSANLAYSNGVIGAVMVISMHVIWFPIISVGIHILLGWFTRKDPLMLPVYFRYNRQGDHYDPWPRSCQTINERPDGFGRGVLC